MKIEIKFIKRWPDDEIISLYKAGGWWKDHYDPSKLKYIITGSLAFVIAVDNKLKKAVGMGRLISDGVSDAYIQDLVVLPEYRGKGIGGEIVKTLIDYCNKKDIHWLALIAEPNQDDFYYELGFKHMDKYVPMKYKKR